MIRRYLLPLLALAGLLIAVATVYSDNRPVRAQPPTVIPGGPPFPSYVAGAGLIEATRGNIAIGAPVAGIITSIEVQVGDRVKAGQTLFLIDDRDLQAQLVTARARVEQAKAALLQPKHLLDYSEDLVHRDPGAVSAHDLTKMRDDVSIAQAALDLAQAQVTQLQMEVDRRTVRAPVAGQILKQGLRVGEYMDSSAATAPLLLLGPDAEPYVRVDVDEADAWRVTPDAKAVGFLPGNPAIHFPLKFQYIEPHVIPKQSLTGRSTERTDTRVLQVLYSFQRGKLPVYVGQQVNVYIQAPPVTAQGE